MWIDILLLILLIIGIYKGWTQGLIISVFAAAAWVLGLTGALKLSTVASVYLRDHLNIQSQYLPVISFVLIFIIIAFMVFLLGKALEKIIEISQLGFINRALGALLKCMVFILLFSIFIWLINQAGFISPETKTESKTFSFLLPAADTAIDQAEKYLPAVKTIFYDIEIFFEDLAKEASEKV